MTTTLPILTVSTIDNASYSVTNSDGTAAADLVDIRVGILGHNTNNIIRHTITVTKRSLLNGNRENRRTTRYSALMNRINAHAIEVWNLNPEFEQAVFLGFASQPDKGYSA